MRHKNRFSWYFIVCLLLLWCVTTVADALSEWDKVLNSTAFIETDIGRGSCFFVGDDKVATCYHVIAGASRGTVTTKSKSFDIVRVTEYNSKWDLAILRVKESPNTHRSASSPSFLTYGTGLDEGEKVYIRGASRDGKPLKSSGPVSNNSSVCEQHEFNITAKTVSGTNGGPVLNMNAKVIGIAIRGTPRTSAVHVKYLEHLSPWEGQGKFPPLNVYNIDPCVLLSLVNMKLEMGAYDSVTEYIESFNDDRLDPIKKQQLKLQVRKAAQKGNKLTIKETVGLFARWLGLVL